MFITLLIRKLKPPSYGKYSAFRASFKQLEEQGYYNENELLNLLLTNVKGEAETALQGILPNSLEYYEAWRILEKRFGDPLKIVQSYRKALKSSPSVPEKNAAQLRSLTDKVTSLISVFKSLGRTGDLLSDSYVEEVADVVKDQMDRHHQSATRKKNVEIVRGVA